MKELRELYALTKTERDDAVASLELEQANSASLEKSYAGAEREIATLNRAIERYEAAMALYEKTIGLVEKQRDDAKADAKRSRKHALVATAVAVFSLLKLTGIAF